MCDSIVRQRKCTDKNVTNWQTEVEISCEGTWKWAANPGEKKKVTKSGSFSYLRESFWTALEGNYPVALQRFSAFFPADHLISLFSRLSFFCFFVTASYRILSFPPRHLISTVLDSLNIIVAVALSSLTLATSQKCFKTVVLVWILHHYWSLKVWHNC